MTSSTTGDGEGAARFEPAQDPVDLTISEAARACGVNRRTIRRHRDAGDFPGAFKDQENVWRIPTADLEAAGFPPYLLARLDEPSEATRLDRLRIEVSLLKERLKATQAIAREREARIQDLRLILRLLPAMAPGHTSASSRLSAGIQGSLPVGGPVSSAGLPPGQRGVMLQPRGISGRESAGERRLGPSGDRDVVPTLTRSGVDDEADTLIWLPESQQGQRQDSPTTPTTPPAPPPRDDPIWRPATPPEPASPPPMPQWPSGLDRRVAAPFPKEPRPPRRGWLPWRRSRK